MELILNKMIPTLICLDCLLKTAKRFFQIMRLSMFHLIYSIIRKVTLKHISPLWGVEQEFWLMLMERQHPSGEEIYRLFRLIYL